MEEIKQIDSNPECNNLAEVVASVDDLDCKALQESIQRLSLNSAAEERMLPYGSSGTNQDIIPVVSDMKN